MTIEYLTHRRVGFNFDTLISDEMARQQAEPYGLAIVPTDDYSQPGPGGLRRYKLLHWREDGMAETVGVLPTEELAADVRGLVIEYVEAHGYDLDRTKAQAMVEYHESLR